MKGLKMIMRNLQNEVPDNNAKFFMLILKTAELFWNQVDEDKSVKTARGLFFVADDETHIINLAYDDRKLYLELCIKLSNNPSIIQERLMLNQDRWSSSLASVTYEKEDHILRIKAKTVLEPSQNPDFPVRAVFEDIKSLVSDDDFQQLLS